MLCKDEQVVLRVHAGAGPACKKLLYHQLLTGLQPVPHGLGRGISDAICYLLTT